MAIDAPRNVDSLTRAYRSMSRANGVNPIRKPDCQTFQNHSRDLEKEYQMDILPVSIAKASCFRVVTIQEIRVKHRGARPRNDELALEPMQRSS